MGDGTLNRPNVIVCMTTQWRAQACGYAGDLNACTPRLDALCREAINFRQAVTPHPFGVFARAAFLTGELCPKNGVEDYFDTLPEGAETLAHRFEREGYDTAFVGKWQLYERDSAAPVVGEAHARVKVPEERRGGFQFWEGFEGGFLLNDTFFHGTRLADPVKVEGYQSDVIVERFCSFLDEREGGEPLFALLSFDAPHPPYAAPASGVEAVDPVRIELPSNVPDDPELQAVVRRELAGYYAHIKATDRAIGRLVDDLKRRGMWETTVFVFTSAHGDMHGSEGVLRKGWPYEEAVRVPLLVSLPGELDKKGEESDGLVSLVDVGNALLKVALSSGVSVEGVEELFEGQALGVQELSMPSVPPFAKQCPYVWTGKRRRESTEVWPIEGEAFTIEPPV